MSSAVVHAEHASKRCPQCTFPHDGRDVLCEVCTTRLPPQEQERYRVQALVKAARVAEAALPPLVRVVPLEPVEPLPAIPTDTTGMGAPCPSCDACHSGACDEVCEVVPPLLAPYDTASLAVSVERPAATARMRLCPVCSHPAVEALNTGFFSDTLTLTAATATYGLHRGALSRHRVDCLGLKRMTKQEAALKGVRAQQARARQCIVCRHPDRDAIDAALRDGVPCVALMERYADTPGHFSDHSASKHRQHYLHIAGRRGRKSAQKLAPQEETTPVPRPTKRAALTPVPFRAHVEAELQRVETTRTRLTDDAAALAARLARLDRERTALRALQEVWREEGRG